LPKRFIESVDNRSCYTLTSNIMQKEKMLSNFGEVALLVWSLICLVIFIYFPGTLSHLHDTSLYDFPILAGKLSRINIATYLLNTLVSFLGVSFFGVACVSLGKKLATNFKLNEEHVTDSHSFWSVLIPTYFLIGNMAFSLIFSTLASLFHLSQMASVIILSLGLLSGLWRLKKFPAIAVRSGTAQEKMIVALSVGILVVSLFQSSARISYDASSIYFSNAKLTALEQQAGYFLENTFVASVFQSTILYSVIIQIFGDQSARMISWLFGAATIPLGVALAGYGDASKLARRILPALILTSTAILDLMGDGKVDLFSAAYCLAAVYWFVKAGAFRQSRNLFILTGSLIGYACILRPQNTFLLGMFIAVHTLQQWRAGDSAVYPLARRVGWMMLGAAGFAVYHLLINKIVLGSALAFWSALTAIDPVNGPWGYTADTIWIYRLLYLVIVSYQNTGASLGTISPLVIAFLPAMAITEIRRRAAFSKNASQLYISTGLVLFLWLILFFTVVEIRYVIFLWIILFIPLAEIIAGLFESGSLPLRVTSFLLVILLMSYIFVRSAYISISTFSPVDEEGNPHCFDTVFCEQISAINEIAAPGDRVLTLSSLRYYLRTDLFACSTQHAEYRALKDLSFHKEDQFWSEVYQQGYKYISYERGYALDHVQLKVIPTPQTTPDWIELEPIFGKPGDSHISYKIHVTDPPIDITSVCRKNNATGNWEVQPVTP
jgi:hypothetical protein